MPSLTRAEAAARAAAIRVTSYAIDLDLTTGRETFRSRTAIRFTAITPATFVELKPVRPHAAVLNGVPLDPAGLMDNRPVTLRVTADPEWTVLANAPGRGANGVWEFAETPPLATYLVTLVAGPYHALRSAHDGIPLGLYCRDSLAPHLGAAELFAFTGACRDRSTSCSGCGTRSSSTTRRSYRSSTRARWRTPVASRSRTTWCSGPP